MTGEGVAEVVEAQLSPPVFVESGVIGGLLQDSLRDVPHALRRTARSCEYPVRWRREWRGSAMFSQAIGELGHQRYLPR
jgi:hypothetical protein